MKEGEGRGGLNERRGGEGGLKGRRGLKGEGREERGGEGGLKDVFKEFKGREGGREGGGGVKGVYRRRGRERGWRGGGGERERRGSNHSLMKSQRPHPVDVSCDDEPLMSPSRANSELCATVAASPGALRAAGVASEGGVAANRFSLGTESDSESSTEEICKCKKTSFQIGVGVTERACDRRSD